MNDRIEQAELTEEEVLAKVNKLKAEKEKLEAENRNLNAKCRMLSDSEARTKEEEYARRQYLQGLVEGLAFAIRCNGVSGDDLETPGQGKRCGR